MKGSPSRPDSPRTVCVIGNFSGRNAGDAAILGGLLEDVHGRYPNTVFTVPTINTDFVRRQYSDFPVRPVGLMPWNLSVKIFGLPLWQCLRRADLVLVTDAILFDRKLFNPLYNYLSTLALALPAAHRRGVPVVLYNVSLGPVPTRAGRTCLRRVLDAAACTIVRDRESFDLARHMGVPDATLFSGADCALNVRPSEARRVDQLIAEKKLGLGPRPVISVNINSYLNVFMKGQSNRMRAAAFAPLMADVMDRMIETFDVNLVVITTQPMDRIITDSVLRLVRRKDRISRITNGECDYRDLAGLFGRADLHVGMRTHSLILASAVGTPVVGLMCTPKNRGYMLSIHQQERMVEFENLSADGLFNTIQAAWRDRARLRSELAPIIAEEQRRARAGAERLAPWLSA